MKEHYMVTAKLYGKDTEITGFPVFCDGQVNTGRVYVCPEVTAMSAMDGIVIGDFVLVDPDTIEPLKVMAEWDGNFGVCPNCGENNVMAYGPHCGRCGQALDWEE